MMRCYALLAVLAIPLGAVAQGKLDAVRDEVDKPKSSDDSSSCSEDSSGTGSSTGDGSAGLFVPLVRFSDYPYARSRGGYLIDGGPGNELAGRASIEVGSDFNGLDRVGLRLFLDTDTIYGLKSDWDYYTERLPGGRRDELWLGDLTVTGRVIGAPAFQMHLGMGPRVMLDHWETRGGLNFLAGFDVFPAEPVHLFGSLEAGTLGNAGLWRVRTGVGVNWTHAELFAGYDCLRIGSVTLQGPFVGLRLWF